MIAKFRGKDIKTGEWVYGYYLKTSDGHGLIYENPPKAGYTATEGFPFQVNPETVGQWTGLKDKNGVEVYKDDVVRVWKPDVYDNDDVILNESNCEKTSSSNVIDLTKSEIPPDGHVIYWNNPYARWQVGLWGGQNTMGENIYEVIGNIHDQKEREE